MVVCVKSTTMALALSAEQRDCVSSDNRGKYCVIKACCGAGKTRVLVGAALEDRRKRVLILSFNRALAEETRAKLKSYRNVDVMTIHKCASLVYGRTVPDNRTLMTLIGKAHMKKEYGGYDLIEFDEGQDVFGVQIQFAALLVAHQQVPPALLIVGDNAQTLYRFLHGDESQSLLQEHSALTATSGPVRWTEKTLFKTQRLTPEITTFVNRYFRHPTDPPLVSAKPPSGVLPEVLIGSDRELLSLVEDLTKRHKPGDVMILCNTLRAKYFAPVETHLVRRGVPVYNVLYDQGGTCDDEAIERIRRKRGAVGGNTSEGKVILSTYHRSKGLERPVVLVVGLTGSFWCMEKTVHNDEPCTSAPAHVAVTRAMDRLVLFMHSYQGMYPTIPSLDDVREVAKVRMYQTPANFDKVVEKDAERKERADKQVQRDKERGTPSNIIFQNFAKWTPEAAMTTFASSVRKINAPGGWWGGTNWDGDGPPESEDAEIELLSSLDDDVLTNAINIYLTEFDCPVMERIKEAAESGRRSSFRYYDSKWTPKLGTIRLPWTGVKTSAKALELAIVHDGLHAVQVGGIGERMHTWENDPKWRQDMEKGFAVICRRLRSELASTDVQCNVTGVNDKDNFQGEIDITSDGNAVAFTTSDENNLTESALRRIMWGTDLLGGAVKLYFLKTYTSGLFIADNQ